MRTRFKTKPISGRGKLGRVLLAGMLASVFCWPAGAQIAWAEDTADWNDGSHGDGLTAATAYEIDSVVDLKSMRDAINTDTKKAASGGTSGTYTGKYFKLTSDIDLDGEAWAAIGSASTKYFDAHFDGNYKTISGLNTGDNGIAGLFGYVGVGYSGTDVSISNLKVEGTCGQEDLSSTNMYSGGLVACVKSGTKNNAFTISNCITNVHVYGTSSAGGLVGQGAKQLKIANCLALGDVTSYQLSTTKSNNVGGLVGCWTTVTNASMTDCLFAGQLTTSPLVSSKKTQNALVGSVNSGFELGTNKYLAQTDQNVGAYSSDAGASSVAPAESKVDKPADKAAAEALAKTLGDGWAVAEIDGSYLPVPKGFAQSGDTSQSYKVTFDANGGTLADGTPTEVSVENGQLAAEPAEPGKDGSDFGGWEDANGNIFDFDTPITAAVSLKAKWVAKGTFPGDPSVSDGSAAHPYIITTEADLKRFAASVNGYSVVSGAWIKSGEPNDYAGKCVKLAGDIAMTMPATPIGITNTDFGTTGANSTFRGNFDGQGHTISNLYFSSRSNPALDTTHAANSGSALFGSVEDAVIQNLSVSLAEGKTYDKHSAGLVGIIGKGNTVIERCSVTGNVQSDSLGPVGGLIAAYTQGNVSSQEASSLSVRYCYHNGTVQSDQSAGGIIGNVSSNNLTMTSCYQAGAVAGGVGGNEYFLGAIVGAGSASVYSSFDKCVSDQATLFGKNVDNASSKNSCVTSVADWTSAKSALGEKYFTYPDAATPPVFGSALSAAYHSVAYAKALDSLADDVQGKLPAGGKYQSGNVYVVQSAGSSLPDGLVIKGFERVGWVVEGDNAVYKDNSAYVIKDTDVVFAAKWQMKAPVVSASATEAKHGEKVTLSIEQSSTYPDGAQYQWYKGAAPVASATGRTLELSNAADSGSYTVVVSYKGYSATSAAYEISISKAQPSLTITPSAMALDGGGKVTFDVTASNVPEGAQIGVSCDDTNLAVSKVDDGKFEATLPDATKTYTFTAAYDGDDNYEAASAQCSVAVTVTPAPTPAPTPKPEHKHTAVTVAGKAATCTQAGLSDGSKCSECGEVIEAQKSIPALGHAWGEWVVTTPATVFAAGIETSTCTRPGCGAIQTRSIAKLGSVTVTSGSVVCSFDGKTVTVTKAAKGKKVIVIPAKVKIAGKWYKVTKIKASAFKGSKATTMIVKSKSLTKKGVKNCLKGSKVSTIKIKVAKSKKVNAKYLVKYKRFFVKKNSSKKAAIR